MRNCPWTDTVSAQRLDSALSVQLCFRSPATRVTYPVPLRNLRAETDRVSVAHYSLESLQGATLSRRRYSVVRSVVFAIPISLVHMAEMAAERGLVISASCIWRWVQVFGPELDKRCRPHLRRTN